VEWWPGRRFDGPSAFSRLLDPEAGHFLVAPFGGSRSTQREYLDGTLVLRTEHETAGGRLRVLDALALEAGARGHEIGLRSPDALIRVVEALDGDVEVEVDYRPRLEYGLAVPRLVRERGRVVSIGGPERLFLSDHGVLDVDGGGARGTFILRAGERRGLLLARAPGVEAPPPQPLDPLAALDDTAAAWRSWAELHHDYDGPYADAVGLASVVLQGLTYQPTGAVVAAASSSLPEIPGGAANWDYRFAWLRDASLIARALLTATCSDEARRYFRWTTRAAVSCRQSSHVQIVFGAAGERQLDERELDHLDGFGGSRPVRIGNAAWRQQQLDVLGEVLDVAHSLGEDLEGELDDFTRDFLCQLVDRAARQWREPDAGMWELRDRDRHHTFSKIMCWVALDRGVRLAGLLGASAEPERWARTRDEIRRAVLDEAWSERRGALAGELGGDCLDAAVLLAPLVGFLDADDPRMRATVRAVEDALESDGLVHRLERDDGEGAFLPASFWLAACHAQAGEPDRARTILERAAECSTDVGLLAEMADPRTREPLGNLPQALSHVGLVTAAEAIGAAERRRAAQGRASPGAAGSLSTGSPAAGSAAGATSGSSAASAPRSGSNR
jgi:GH15 family glucan-1,4-alpha-glucosidase